MMRFNRAVNDFCTNLTGSPYWDEEVLGASLGAGLTYFKFHFLRRPLFVRGPFLNQAPLATSHQRQPRVATARDGSCLVPGTYGLTEIQAREKSI